MKYKVPTFLMFAVVCSSFLGAMEAEYMESDVYASELVAPEQMSQLPAELIPYIISYVAAEERVFATKQLLMEIKKGRQEYLRKQAEALKSVYKSGTWELACEINHIFCHCAGLKKEEAAVARIEAGADVNCSFPTRFRERVVSAFEIAMDLKLYRMLRAALRAGAWLDRRMNSYVVTNVYKNVPLAQACGLFMKEAEYCSDHPEDEANRQEVERSARVIELLLEGGADADVAVELYDQTKPAYEWFRTGVAFKAFGVKVNPGYQK